MAEILIQILIVIFSVLLLGGLFEHSFGAILASLARAG